MLRQIFFGAGINIVNIAIHAIAMVVILRSRAAVHASVPSHPMLRLVGIMIAVVSILMAAHLLEITMWSIAYQLLGVAPEVSDSCILLLSITRRSDMATSFRSRAGACSGRWRR